MWETGFWAGNRLIENFFRKRSLNNKKKNRFCVENATYNKKSEFRRRFEVNIEIFGITLKLQREENSKKSEKLQNCERIQLMKTEAGEKNEINSRNWAILNKSEYSY